MGEIVLRGESKNSGQALSELFCPKVETDRRIVEIVEKRSFYSTDRFLLGLTLGSLGCFISPVITLFSVDFESRTRKKMGAAASAIFGASFAGAVGFMLGYRREINRINELRISLEQKKKTPGEIQALAVQLFTVIVSNYHINKRLDAKKCNLFASGIPLYINPQAVESDRIGIAYCSGQKKRVKDFISHYCDLLAISKRKVQEYGNVWNHFSIGREHYDSIIGTNSADTQAEKIYKRLHSAKEFKKIEMVWILCLLPVFSVFLKQRLGEVREQICNQHNINYAKGLITQEEKEIKIKKIEEWYANNMEKLL